MATSLPQTVPTAAGPLAGLRVLYFYQYFTTPRGSYSTRVYEFARRWVKSGAMVTVITSAYDKSDLRPKGMLDRFDIEGIDVRIFNIRLSNKHGFLTRVLTFVWFSLAACWYALTLPADVVVASSGPITVGLPGLVARYIRRRPLVFEVRDLWPEGAVQLGFLRNPLLIRAARGFEGLCYAASTRIVALSDGMAQWIESRRGDRPVTVVPNASDNELAALTRGPSELPAWAAGRKLALYTGALGVANDCEQILQIARRLTDWGLHDIKIVIAGDGKERPGLERRAGELGLRNVHFIGGIPKEEVMGWLRIAFCALFVAKDLRYVDTASPNKVFDAFAAGTPVLQTTQGWIKNLLERENCGVTVAPYQAEEQARALVRLAQDSEYRARLAANALRVARDQFDRGLLAARMASVLASAARRNESPE